MTKTNKSSFSLHSFINLSLAKQLLQPIDKCLHRHFSSLFKLRLIISKNCGLLPVQNTSALFAGVQQFFLPFVEAFPQAKKFHFSIHLFFCKKSQSLVFYW